MRRTALLTTAVAAAIAVAATGGWAAQPADVPPRAPAPSDTAAEARGAELAAQRAESKGVDWKECPSGRHLPGEVRCGTVTVPVDYAHPKGPSIDLAVDRVPAKGTHEQRQGSLLINPGGPGGPGLDMPVTTGGNTAVWGDVARAYDLVGFDPRGVGHSAPVSCTDPARHAEAPKPDPVPDGEAGRQQARQRAREYAQGCRERTGALLPHVDTPNTARDMDVIRAALGEKKLNYLGMSYGTYLGAVYGTLFPGHVRRMALDSVVDPSGVWYENHRAQVPVFERRFGEWKEWVARHDDAFHLGDTAQKVQKRWERLRERAKQTPLGGTAGPYELTELIMMTMYFDNRWVPTTAAWAEYEAGRPEWLIKAARSSSTENATAAYTAVTCNDASSPKDPARWDEDAERLHRRAPFLAWFSQRMNLPCAFWPERPRTPVDVRTREGLPPVLLVQNEGDAATPAEGAAELHRRFTGSRMITVRGAGQHIAAHTVNPCVNSRVDGYFLRGDAGDHDVTCERAPAPPPQSGP